MREDRFDDKIRELLNDAHESYDSSSWDLLNERLEASDLDNTAEESDYIPVIKEKLENQRASVPEEHWNELKSELDYIQERRERLFIVKALEAAIVLLLFYTYYNYKWLTNQPELEQEYFVEIVEESINPSSIDAVANVIIDQNQQYPLEIASISSFQLEQRTPIAVTPLSTQNQEVYSVWTKSSVISSSEKIADRLTRELHSSSKGKLSSLLDKLSIEALNRDLQKPLIPLMVLPEEREKINEYSGWSVTVPFSYDVNFINTDINLGYLSNQIQSGLDGRSVGLGIAYRKKNLQLESGLMYSEKTFVPGALTNYSRSSENSYLESQLEVMNIEQIQIPLTLKWYASPARSSSLYAVAGFAVNAITHNDYDIGRTIQSKARLANTPVAEVIDLRDLPRGLAKGGTIDDNVYVTGVLGFGVESVIKNGTSWYIQPQYQHSFTSDINELVNKINSLNIQGGLRFSF